MPYLKIKPAAPLSHLVESIDVQEVLDSKEQLKPTKILPNGSIDLVFYYGDLFIHADPRNISKETFSPNAFVFGQRTSAFNVRASGSTGIVIVRFYPWGFSAFTGIPLNNFSERCVHLDEVFPQQGGTRCLDLIVQATSPIQKIAVMQTFLIEQLQMRFLKGKPDLLVASVCQQININNGSVSINELAQQVSLSKRHLARRFLNSVGITPKKFANITRFQKSLYFRSCGLTAVDVASMAGYFDQAHMHKEFQQFADCKPRELFQSKPATPLMARYNHHKMSHFYNTRYLQ